MYDDDDDDIRDGKELHMVPQIKSNAKEWLGGGYAMIWVYLFASMQTGIE